MTKLDSSFKALSVLSVVVEEEYKVTLGLVAQILITQTTNLITKKVDKVEIIITYAALLFETLMLSVMVRQCSAKNTMTHSSHRFFKGR